MLYEPKISSCTQCGSIFFLCPNTENAFVAPHKTLNSSQFIFLSIDFVLPFLHMIKITNMVT